MNAVIVTGSRDWTDAVRIRDALLQTKAEWGDFRVLDGGARGADQLACEIAHALGLVTRTFPANWQRYGKRAGVIRNAEMLQVAQAEYKRVYVLAFPLPQSIGTRHMLATSAPAVEGATIARCLWQRIKDAPSADAGVARAAKIETREFAPNN